MISKSISKKTQELSLKDTKTISQIGLKMAEEFGELAKVLLPYDNADGTRHRFVSKDAIIDGVVDIILVADSLRYRLKITDERMERAFHTKLLKWERLQSIPMDESYPYEIHVTVKEVSDVNTFREDCVGIGVKPIILDLHTSTQGILKDMMTSSTLVGNNADVIDEVERITLELEARGYTVIRQKIETVPWHPHASGDRTVDNYFEAHLPVTIDESRQEDLYYFTKRYPGTHLSRNSLKRHDDGSMVLMVTMRHSDLTFDVFKTRYDALRAGLSEAGYDIGSKKIVEWAIYDSHVRHDDQWLSDGEE